MIKSQKDSWQVSRRELVRIGALIGGGLIVGCRPRGGKLSAVVEGGATAGLCAFIHVSKDGKIVLFAPRSEMGQGILTGLVTLVSEEMDVPPDQIDVQHALVDSTKYYNNALPKIGTLTNLTFGALGLQMTGGSSSMKGMYMPLRLAAAAARSMLVKTAVAQLGGAENEWQIRGDKIVRVNKPGVELKLSQIVEAASRQAVPSTPTLRHPNALSYIGKNVPRVDTKQKISGKAIFGCDIQRPNMLIATVVHSPYVGGKIVDFRADAVKDIPGIRKIFKISQGIAIVADKFWQAMKAAEVFHPLNGVPNEKAATWTNPKNVNTEQLNTTQLNITNGDTWKDFLLEELGAIASVATGGITGSSIPLSKRVENAWDAGPKRLVSYYSTPFVPHSTMEPMNCTIEFDGNRCEVWAPTQYPSGAQETIHKLTGLPLSSIVIHTTLLGGGFGRRLYNDFIGEALEIAKVMQCPIKMMWTRAEDTRNDYFRPASAHRMRAALSTTKNVTCWEHKGVSQSLYTHFIDDWSRDVVPSLTPELIKNIAGRTAVDVYKNTLIDDEFVSEGADTLAYQFPLCRVAFQQHDTPFRVGFWRSVGHSYNAFVVESFVDELAHLAGREPAEFRRSHLGKARRNLNVLNYALDNAGYEKEPPPGIFRGIAQHQCFGSFCAQVIEIAMVGRKVVVKRVVAAIDCGFVVNPNIVKAQIESAIIFGLSAALKQQISAVGGKIQQSNFHDCDVLRIYETPEIEVHIVPSTEPPTGVGEPGVPPVAPALCNAIFKATGIRIKKLPIGEIV